MKDLIEIARDVGAKRIAEKELKEYEIIKCENDPLSKQPASTNAAVS